MRKWVVQWKSPKYGDCLISPFSSRESAEEYVKSLRENPPEKYKESVEKYGDDAFSVVEVEEKNCWWDDPFLCN